MAVDIPILLTFVEACSIAMESLLYQETVSIMFTFKFTFTAAQVPAITKKRNFALQSTALVSFTRTHILKTTAITTLPILDDLCYSKIKINYPCDFKVPLIIISIVGTPSLGLF